MAAPPSRPVFAVCVASGGSDDLSVGRLYRVLPDEGAFHEGLLRVVDDSGEDFLYSADRFVIVTVSPVDEPKLLEVAPIGGA